MKFTLVLLLVLAMDVSLCQNQLQPFTKPQLFFKRISTDQGLAQPSVNSIIRDSRGFVWMATEDGLCRFDGSEFRVFKNDPADSTSLSHNVVHFIVEQEDTGNLWIGTVSGLSYFIRSMEKFRVYKFNDQPGIVYANASYDKKRNRLWLACTLGGLRYLDFATNKIEQVSDHNLNKEKVWTVEVAGDSLLIGTLNGLQILNLKSDQVSQIDKTVPVRSLLVDNTDIWFGMEGLGLGRISRKTKQISHYSKVKGQLSSDDVWSLAKDRDDNLWIGSDGGGLNVLYRGDSSATVYLHSGLDDRSISSNTIRSIYIEPSGNAWLGTFNGGVNYHEVSPFNLRLYKKEMSDDYSISNNSINAFAEGDGGKIWIGTDGGGLNYLESSSHTIHSFPLPGLLNRIKVITALRSDGDGLWIGTFQHGLIHWNGKQSWKQYTHRSANSSSLSNNNVWTIQKDSSGYLWIGTDRGPNRFDPNTEIFNSIDNPLTGKAGMLFQDIQTQSILISSNQTIWFGLYGLLIGYVPSQDSIFEVKPSDGHGRVLPDFRVKALLEDNSKIWIGTYGNGLCLYNPVDGTLRIIDERDGLPDNMVLSIQKGTHESLWLGTNKGLVHFNESDSSFKVMSRYFGSQGNTFNRNSSLKTFNGSLFFGGHQGFNVFSSEERLYAKSSVLKVVLTGLRVFNQLVMPGSTLLKRSITETDQLSLSHRDSRMFTIEFTAFDFIEENQISYSYKLSDFSNDWQNILHDKRITFTNLDPGSYDLAIRASYNGQHWGPAHHLEIIIKAPWWKTIYFRLGSVLLICFTVLIVFQYRTAHLKNRKKELEHLVGIQSAEISKKNQSLSVQNEELTAQNEELLAQRETITSQNILLSDAKASLLKINGSLEETVNQRTEKLNQTIVQLNKSIKELDAFVYSASHDLNAPLKSVLGLIGLVKMEGKPELLHEYVEHIEFSVLKLEEVVKNLIYFSQNSNLETVTEPVDLRNLIETCISDLAQLKGFNAIVFEIKIDSDVQVASDYGRLKVIFSNLLSNSVKYKDVRKDINSIKITFNSGKTVWKTVIEDNGIGIEKQYLSRVFEMFYRATDRSQGAGLGLYIVKETVERLYGEVHVDSDLGKWTRVSVTFPHEPVYIRKK